MPLSTDNVDQNGPGVNGDNPELLGAITLSGIPAGAQLLDGTNSNALLWTSSGGSVTIVLTDQTDYHINGASGTLYMTKAQYEALQVLPPADSGVNFSVTVSVTSYEVDNSGNPLSGVPGAINTATVDVDVRAVTDDVELWIDGVKSTVVTIDEDTTLNLSTLLTKQFNDTDGSEQRSIVITGLPAGTVVNGTTIDGSGTITIPLTGGNTIPSITVKPPKDFSGDINNITITLRAQDTDSDSSHTPNVENDSVTLNIYVNPIAGDVKVSGVTTDEDTAVKFLQHLEVTDTDGSEEITGITINALQVGWVIRDGGGNIIFTGDGTTDYTVSAVDVASEAYKNYTVTPPAHSSQDEDISISVETTDTQTVNGSPETSVVVTDMDVTVEVAAVPEVVGTDTDGDGTDDLTMNPDHNYSTPAYEDTWFDLQQNGFNLKNGWSNQDPDEQTYALLKPILNGGLNSAVGSQFKYYNGSSWVTLTYNGSALEIPAEYLDTVQFKAAHNVKGMFEIEVQAKTVDVDPDTGNTVSAVSGSASLTNVVVLPVADKVTLSVSSPMNTPEDTLVNLKVRPSSSDSSETFNITIANIPPGAKIYYGGAELTVDGDGKVFIDNFLTSKTLAILPPPNSNDNFTLNVSAQSVDTDGGYTNVSDAVSLPISVIVKGVADPAILDVKDFTTTEAIVDGAGNTIALSNVIDNIGLTDTDGSETLTLVLTGLDPKFSVVGATYVGGDGVNRVWIVDASKLATTHIVTSENFSGTINLNLRAITTENDGDSLTGALKPVTIEVTPSPESTIVSSTTTHEDTPARLNFNIVHHNDDNDETLTSVWIKASDVEGKNFTLYYGSSTATTLADAAADSGIPLVVLEDGYYKLTGSAINNIYGKGAPNTHGSFNFDIKYEITDPSSDSTLPSVTEQTDGSYNFIVNAVTDQTETSIDLITGDKPSVIISGNQVTVTENSTVSVTIKVEQAHDPNANNQQDYDGSEQLITIVVDGVPNGVTVGNAVYIGNTPGNPNTGQWLIQVNPNVDFNGPLTHTVVLYFDGTAAELSSLNQSIIISAHSEDFNSVTVSSSTVIVITTPADFDDTSSSSGTPVDIIEAEFIPLPVANEDTPITLADIAKFTTNGTSDFSITLTGLPPGTVISGMVQTTVNGETVWTASGTGGNAALQTLLASIIITPPLNWNSNNSSNLSFDATLTTYSEGGIRSDDSITINQPITPVTDDTDLSLSIVDALEGNDVTMTLNMSNPADNTHLNIIGEKLYVSLDETGMDSPGTLWHEGNQLSLTYVSGVTGVADGYYYIVEGVSDITQPVDLIYRPAEHSSGQATITTTLVGQEDNAANIVTNTVTETLTVEPVNSGYDISTNNISGSEDSKIALDYTSTGLVDADGSESVLTAILGNLPNGYLVYYGADEASAVLAHNLGADAFGNTSWSIPINGGGLPPYIAILPPEHYSGTITDLTLSVISGENGLDPEISTATFDMEVVPFADGLSISPTSTFGNEGDYVSLNLNASIIDTDGSETVTLEVKGLGEYASFYSGTSLISSSYDSATDTYTVSGIAASEIDNIAFIQSARTGTIEVKAYTVETSNGDTSAPATGTFDIDIFETIATPGDDTLLYSGGKALDGFTGNDTVVMRFNEGIDFDTDPVIRNIEVFDLRGDTSGSNVLQNLSVQDVMDITDSNNTLTIFGDSNDHVSLLDDGNWTITTVNDGGIDFDVYTHAIHTDVVLKIQQDLITNLIDITETP